MSWDPYLDLDTGVLRNRLDITDTDELSAVEAGLTTLRLFELQQDPLPGHYDLAHLQDFHERIFGDVYDWAGQLRTVSIGKGQLFCLPQHLESFANEVFAEGRRAALLRTDDLDEFITGLAEWLADINALHPFREGNGRTQRAFLAQFARAAGYELRWTMMDPAENNQASQRGDPGPAVGAFKRLFALVSAPLQSVTYRLRWAWWRRRHQARARWFHHRARLASLVAGRRQHGPAHHARRPRATTASPSTSATRVRDELTNPHWVRASSGRSQTCRGPHRLGGRAERELPARGCRRFVDAVCGGRVELDEHCYLGRNSPRSPGGGGFVTYGEDAKQQVRGQ